MSTVIKVYYIICPSCGFFFGKKKIKRLRIDKDGENMIDYETIINFKLDNIETNCVNYTTISKGNEIYYGYELTCPRCGNRRTVEGQKAIPDNDYVMIRLKTKEQLFECYIPIDHFLDEELVMKAFERCYSRTIQNTALFATD